VFRNKYDCFFFNERFVLEVGVGMNAIPATFLMFKLLQVNDAYGIKPEVVCVISTILVAAGSFMLLQLRLVHFFCRQLPATLPGDHS